MGPKESTASSSLSSDESHVLFDILTHHAVYSEIRRFRESSAIHSYGPPFMTKPAKSPSAPILQTLLSRFVLTLPGLRQVSPSFWTERVGVLLKDLADAELSESYDKGSVGIRKTITTGISALVEYPARGSLGGYPRSEAGKKQERREYDTSDPQDVMDAWKDCLEEVIYGGLIQEMFDRTKETDKLQEHPTLVQGMHEFIVVNLASFMHYTLVASPEGSAMLQLAEQVHRLIPYTIIRQTLKIGNVASMLSALVRVVLAKVSVASFTNWLGVSSGADEGMNLMQQIISQVLSRDKRDLRTKAEKLEKGTDAPPKGVRTALLEWIDNNTREEHAEARRLSEEQKLSIITVILSLSASSVSADDLTPAQHANTLQWYAHQLAIRDRREIVRVLCKRNPDLLTTAVNDAVAAYTPMIRQVHQAVNLSDTVSDAERFITDLLKMSKPNATTGAPATVEDYVDLLHRHQTSTHKFLHQVVKNSPDLSKTWLDWAHGAASQFRSFASIGSGKHPEEGTQSLIKHPDVFAELEAAFGKLSPTDQASIRKELQAHAKHVADLHEASRKRVVTIIRRNKASKTEAAKATPTSATTTTSAQGNSSDDEDNDPFEDAHEEASLPSTSTSQSLDPSEPSDVGPGVFLARWQMLIDNSALTPKPSTDSGNGTGRTAKRKMPVAPSTETSVRLFGEKFEGILLGRT